jgi:hypothetical protein
MLGTIINVTVKINLFLNTFVFHKSGAHAIFDVITGVTTGDIHRICQCLYSLLRLKLKEQNVSVDDLTPDNNRDLVTPTIQSSTIYIPIYMKSKFCDELFSFLLLMCPGETSTFGL